ncbi:MAG: hypothetical protein GKR84_05820 [Candidatus Nanopelagicales bacterium]|nr:hypothetical protein [Actinomycetes bacterium]MCH9707129.1 hypothetical protein [Actinomycetes bacterium]NKB94097.1 hypothetical protein [Candidatus Nanopelagicales bacterium]
MEMVVATHPHNTYEGTRKPVHQDQDQPVPRDTMMHHEVQVRRVQRHFLQSVCSCGWLSAARRSSSLAVEEGQDHAILFDGASTGIPSEGAE